MLPVKSFWKQRDIHTDIWQSYKISYGLQINKMRSIYNIQPKPLSSKSLYIRCDCIKRRKGREKFFV